MSGFVKLKQYNCKDSSLAMFGSDDEKKVSSPTQERQSS